MFEDVIGKHKTEIDTPALLLYMDAVERNIKTMVDFFADKPCKLRPHIKTHKLPLIARKQIESGAVGITCAKLGELKIFFESGIKDTLIANEIVGLIKIQRLVKPFHLWPSHHWCRSFPKCKRYFRGTWKDWQKNKNQ